MASMPSANHDPISGVNVLSRGIVGDIAGELVVASPLYKQHFSLISGRCLEEPEHAVPVYLARTQEGQVWVRAEPVMSPRIVGRRRLIVIGNGVAAMRTIEELLQLAPQAYDITVFGAEEHSPYNRYCSRRCWPGKSGPRRSLLIPLNGSAIRALPCTWEIPSCTSIGRAAACDPDWGWSSATTRLLIATGSTPVVLPVPGGTFPES